MRLIHSYTYTVNIYETKFPGITIKEQIKGNQKVFSLNKNNYYDKSLYNERKERITYKNIQDSAELYKKVNLNYNDTVVSLYKSLSTQEFLPLKLEHNNIKHYFDSKEVEELFNECQSKTLCKFLEERELRKIGITVGQFIESQGKKYKIVYTTSKKVWLRLNKENSVPLSISFKNVTLKLLSVSSKINIVVYTIEHKNE